MGLLVKVPKDTALSSSGTYAAMMLSCQWPNVRGREHLDMSIFMSPLSCLDEFHLAPSGVKCCEEENLMFN